MNKNPFIHLFQTSNGNYIYDVNTDSILAIGKDEYEYLCTIKTGKKINDIPEHIKFLEEKGYLKEVPKRITEHPATELLEFHANNRIESIILQVTQNCNLRCSYCAYSGGYVNRVHNNKRMSRDIAKKGIDFLIKHSRDCDVVSIGFYGGEPLLEFELIKYCINYAIENIEDKVVKYNLTTNATLLNREIIEFFEKYDVNIMISLDGPEEIHNKNRRFADNNTGSYDAILERLQLIKDEYPKYFENNVHYNTVLATDNFSCINKFLNKEDLFQNALFLSAFLNHANAKFKDIKSHTFFEENAYAMFIGYLTILGKVKKENSSKLLQTSFNSIGNTRVGKKGKQRDRLPNKWHHGGPCVPGVMRLFINADGNFYPCEKVSEDFEEMIIGNLDEGFCFDRMKSI
ncbi:MAG: radical SAM protein, partial [Eubacteriales bacterium]